jgi:hypothetical protein
MARYCISDRVAGEAGDLVKADSPPAQLDKQFEVLKKFIQPDF